MIFSNSIQKTMKRSYQFDALRGASKKLCQSNSTQKNSETDFVLKDNPVRNDDRVEVFCQEIGGYEAQSCSCFNEVDMEESDESREFENQENQEEYEFLKNFYSHESSKYGENDLLSNHSFQSVERIVTDIKLEKIMRKLLRFAVKAKLSESSLESVLELFKETLQDFNSISEKDSYYFTLKGFYDYFYISRKTIMVHYCTKCGEYERNKNVKKCNCEIEWKNHSYCFLRPLKFQLDERIFFEKDFNNQFFEKVEDIKDGIVSDRVHGSVYQQHHKKLFNEGKLKTISAFFDSVCPFNNSTNAFYQGSFNFNEMKPHLRRKRSNNFLWILAPKKPDFDG
ncbi:predicted protein [Naegleria gruberi]|uniref:Predicted protein n=1 Tax=Naegleria gruberi TaxID=5762 RepID=D2V182_NAEGR|nr:uncharacterized protein NAEGRDRAFT_46017 [Naegleria gruberi]EFC49423.1 predicted protein [Naegleria gruberi]|eukprot:XP_002682167.1 predicted protein [Naegleria gruberi strain NEG-M]